MTSVSLIGVGRMGSAVALALSRADYRIDHLVYRTTPPSNEFLALISSHPASSTLEDVCMIDSDVLVIAVGDEAIENVALAAAPLVKPGTVCLHLSGSLSSEVLRPLAKAGGECGSMHPLVSVSDGVMGAESFSGSYFCIEGSPNAVEIATSIAEKLGGRAFSISSEVKPLYHAAAVLASGHATALFAAACEALTSCGLTFQESREALLPLLRSTAANLGRQPPADALTGPFARGDAAAVERHIAAFRRAELDGLLKIYLELGLVAVRLAEARGLNDDAVSKLEETILLALGQREVIKSKDNAKW